MERINARAPGGKDAKRKGRNGKSQTISDWGGGGETGVEVADRLALKSGSETPLGFVGAS